MYVLKGKIQYGEYVGPERATADQIEFVKTGDPVELATTTFPDLDAALKEFNEIAELYAIGSTLLNESEVDLMLVELGIEFVQDEPEDDDPTCIECGWHRSEHAFQDHGFQRRLTDAEYRAEQEQWAREYDDVDGLNHEDEPDDDEEPYMEQILADADNYAPEDAMERDYERRYMKQIGGSF